ncbi:MAG: hypothetical protein HY248_06180 [Fimbriimonas ginsengisoli]|uniref:Uncharacterized protein n=1 Tax=Fimbriimonas ginsengisoli TaxID=1005039 RepID=A0A931PUA7_FIMGI|nr:hypothetical protein [Fimbriimonas ginsengisoli]MBI3722124.1 hypothetical protein [Fimbriimonas ginsengisoli]
MVETLSILKPGPIEEFPDLVYVLKHPGTGRYGCFCHDGVHGLACFSTEGGAFRFSEWIDLSGMQSLEMSFDEAREVAKGRPMPVVALMLLDSIREPKVHFVR